MESHDSYPVFHTRMARTLRRRLTKPDGWLILTTDQLNDVPAEPISLNDASDELSRSGDDPPQVAIPHPRLPRFSPHPAVACPAGARTRTRLHAERADTTTTHPPAPQLTRLHHFLLPQQKASLAMPERLLSDDFPTEVWTITLAFAAPDATKARYIALDVTRRLADVLPGYDKNYVALCREEDPGVMIPVYCCDDIYCHRQPDHDGPCTAEDGTHLDTNADSGGDL